MNHLEKLLKNRESIIAFLSIKPLYAEKLLAGVKKYEFRRNAIRPDLTHIIIYATSPIKMIVGVAEVKKVSVGSPAATWEKTKQAAGITRQKFREYFSGSKQAYSIEVKKMYPFDNWVDPSIIEKDFNVPQSFSYVNQSFLRKLVERGI